MVLIGLDPKKRVFKPILNFETNCVANKILRKFNIVCDIDSSAVEVWLFRAFKSFT